MNWLKRKKIEITKYAKKCEGVIKMNQKTSHKLVNIQFTKLFREKEAAKYVYRVLGPLHVMQLVVYILILDIEMDINHYINQRKLKLN